MQLIRFQIQPKSGRDLLEQTWCLQHVSAGDSLQISLVFKEKDVGMVGRWGGEEENEGKLQGGKKSESRKTR